MNEPGVVMPPWSSITFRLRVLRALSRFVGSRIERPDSQVRLPGSVFVRRFFVFVFFLAVSVATMDHLLSRMARSRAIFIASYSGKPRDDGSFFSDDGEVIGSNAMSLPSNLSESKSFHAKRNQQDHAPYGTSPLTRSEGPRGPCKNPQGRLYAVCDGTQQGLLSP